MSQPANDDFSQHLSDGEESNHEEASDTGAAPKQPQQMIPQTTAISNIKLPILKKEEYDIWAMEMEHYLEYIDNDVGKERLKYFLLMAIPKEHMRRFHGMDDAKEIWEAIRTSKIYQGAPKTISVLPKLLLLFHKSKVSNNKVKSGFQESYSSFTPSILLQPMYPEKEVSCRQIAIDCYSNEEVRIRKQEGEFLVDGKTPVGLDKKN
ncbi:hypothetical protein Tco_0526118 [Tanacetum coccineum]